MVRRLRHLSTTINTQHEASRIGVSYGLYAHRREECSGRTRLSRMQQCGRQTDASDVLGALPPMSSLRPRVGPSAATPIVGGELRRMWWRTRLRPVGGAAAPFGSPTKPFHFSQSARVSWSCGISPCGDAASVVTRALTCLTCGPWMCWCAASASSAPKMCLDSNLRTGGGESCRELVAVNPTQEDRNDSTLARTPSR